MSTNEGTPIPALESNGKHAELANTAPSAATSSSPRSKSGWDGKLRVQKTPVILDPEALSDPEESDEDAPPPDVIDADEDLLEGLEEDIDEIDLVHCKISSIPALRLERFKAVEKLCLRQNQISTTSFPSNLGPTLKDLDLYDNLIKHVEGLDELTELTSLDLSFNKIKHIKRVNHLKKLENIYFVQNKIQTIENLDGLENLKNLELAANRIRTIQNLESLTTLTELWLGKNKITEMRGLDTLTNLTILSIQSNRLTSLSGLSSLHNLTELHVSHNLIDSIGTSLSSNTNLRVIDISSNPIAHLDGLAHLAHLEELWASNCRLESYDEIEKELKDKKELSTVYFEGNPLQRKDTVLYRNKVRLAVPQIKQIDATYVKVS